MKIENICALKKIKKLKDNSQDIIYADPPYALGSTVLIGKNGKPYYKEARDFMSKWEMPDDKFWEEFFKEANRVLKYGGRVLFFGIDRQLFLFQYYAVASGIEIKQSLYWYFISNFPKATDLSKQIEKRLGVEMLKPELISENIAMGGEITKDTKRGYPETDLGKKYEGFKYSISPLKQVLETVMVFQKPTKNKSVLDDVFAYEDGDESISPSVWGIDGGRVPTSDVREKKEDKNKSVTAYGDGLNGDGLNGYDAGSHDLGRFPSQLFIDKECTSKIDEQSGELTSGALKEYHNRSEKREVFGKYNGVDIKDRKDYNSNSGGASRILHHIEYFDEELDLVIYSPKVSTFEREVGCGEFDKKSNYEHEGRTGQINSKQDMNGHERKPVLVKNSHPTLKPIGLNHKIFQLLKTPNPQNVFFPFSGAGSEIIGAIQAGFDSDLFECSEISEEFVAIAEARVKAWENLDINELESSKKHIEKLSKEDSRQGSLF